MTLVDQGVCSLTSCPFRNDGTCLENFTDPRECPNWSLEDVAAIESATADDTELEFEPDPVPVLEEGQRNYVGGDAALSLSEANSVTASRPSRVVVVAGEFASGKTTLVVELFARFLTGAFGGWIFGGSKTLRAFHLRHKPALLSSGARIASTERTQDDDMRLLHLDLYSSSSRVNLLLSDVKGEFFGDLVNGGKVEVAVPLAARADLCVFVIDGEKLVTPAARSMALWRAEMMLAGLTEPGGLEPGVPVLIVISKSDKLTKKQFAEVEDDLGALLEFAKERGLEPSILPISARPEDPTAPPVGLEEFLGWLVENRKTPDLDASVQIVSSGRHYWRKGY